MENKTKKNLTSILTVLIIVFGLVYFFMNGVSGLPFNLILFIIVLFAVFAFLMSKIHVNYFEDMINTYHAVTLDKTKRKKVTKEFKKENFNQNQIIIFVIATIMYIVGFYLLFFSDDLNVLGFFLIGITIIITYPFNKKYISEMAKAKKK